MKAKIEVVQENKQRLKVKAILDGIATTFFGLFSVKEGCKVDLSDINQLFITEGNY